MCLQLQILIFLPQHHLHCHLTLLGWKHLTLSPICTGELRFAVILNKADVHTTYCLSTYILQDFEQKCSTHELKQNTDRKVCCAFVQHVANDLVTVTYTNSFDCRPHILVIYFFITFVTNLPATNKNFIRTCDNLVILVFSDMVHG